MAASESEILGRLRHVRRLPRGHNGQDRWDAYCPAHETSHHSLAVARFPDGGWMLKCYAGCTQDEVLGAVGLRVVDLVPDSGSQNRMPKGHNGRSMEYNRMVRMIAQADRENGRRLSKKDKDLELSAWVSLKAAGETA
jgi:putative DNA primase/helicase